MLQPLTNDRHAKLKATDPNSKRKKERQKPETKTLLAGQHRLTTPFHTGLDSPKRILHSKNTAQIKESNQ